MRCGNISAGEAAVGFGVHEGRMDQRPGRKVMMLGQ